VQANACHAEFLEVGCWWNICNGERRKFVYVRAEGVDDGMDEQRAQVFNDEDGAPCYLWTEIFDVDIATVPKTSAFDGDILVIGDQ
jgi:hypothetical protein